MAVPAVKASTGAPFYLHRADLPILHELPERVRLWLDMDVDPVPDPDGYLEHGQIIQVGEEELEVRFTPGHAPGHVVFVHHAGNQVLIRSINTTIIGVLPVAALLITGTFILGTGPLKDLGLALFVGMVAGAYSSIFLAAPLFAQMKELEPAQVAHRARLTRRTSRHAGRGEAFVVAGWETVGEVSNANVTGAEPGLSAERPRGRSC